jgi:hypothetical protein
MASEGDMGSNTVRRYCAAWLYKCYTLDNRRLLDDLKRLRINLVFLSVDQASLSQCGDKLVDFIGGAHAHGIDVDAMTLEDARFAETGQHAQACAIVSMFVEFVKANPGSAFDGIQIDTEPEALFDSHDDAFKKSLMEQNHSRPHK